MMPYCNYLPLFSLLSFSYQLSGLLSQSGLALLSPSLLLPFVPLSTFLTNWLYDSSNINSWDKKQLLLSVSPHLSLTIHLGQPFYYRREFLPVFSLIFEFIESSIRIFRFIPSPCISFLSIIELFINLDCNNDFNALGCTLF